MKRVLLSAFQTRKLRHRVSGSPKPAELVKGRARMNMGSYGWPYEPTGSAPGLPRKFAGAQAKRTDGGPQSRGLPI